MNRLLLVLGLGFTTVSMNACDSIYWDEGHSVAEVKAQGEMVVLTAQSPLIYSKPKRGEAFGIDHDLIQSFAQHYDIKVRYVVLPNEEAVVRALATGQGDVAAARLRTPSKNMGFLNGPAYEESYLSLYCHKAAEVQNIADLAGKRLSLLSKDNYMGLARRLRQLSPELKIQIVPNQRTQNLMADLAVRKSDCVIVENVSGDFYSRYHTSVEKVTQLSGAFSISWMLAPHKHDLLRLMQAWFQKASRDDEIMRVADRYKAYLNQLDRQDISRFFRMIQTTLPTYQDAFQKAAGEHGLPWQLIASVAYQESHWNPEARSFTGVRGLMQLTEDTAEHMGIEDRTDPLQSIAGGSKYLRTLYNRTPKNLNAKDRLALALAAYNVGSAHLADAQKLAEKMGKNPNSWRQLREILPLLADPSYASDLQYGPARGHETVQFVERVKSFYNLMNSAG
jgi:membrane-bound lytic murein transglycosylase F